MNLRVNALFLKENPGLHPKIAVLASTRLIQIVADERKDAKAALALCEEAIQKNGKDAAVDALFPLRARLLVALNQSKDVDAAFEADWERLTTASWREANNAVRAQCALLDAQGEGDKVTALLEKTLTQMPQLFDTYYQIPRGWMYDRLVEGLLRQKRAEDALAFAKLRFATCLDEEQLNKAAMMLSRVYAAQGAPKETLLAFVKAQRDPTLPNPLAAVKLTDGPTAVAPEPLCRKPVPAMVTMVPEVPVAGASEVSTGPFLSLLQAARARKSAAKRMRRCMKPPGVNEYSSRTSNIQLRAHAVRCVRAVHHLVHRARRGRGAGVGTPVALIAPVALRAQRRTS
jgi:hypothetical protein